MGSQLSFHRGRRPKRPNHQDTKDTKVTKDTKIPPESSQIHRPSADRPEHLGASLVFLVIFLVSKWRLRREPRYRGYPQTANLIALLLAVMTFGGRSAHAQVIEIGPQGEARTYDRPNVFTADGVRPIGERASAAPATAGLAGAAEAADLDPELVGAVAWRESDLRADRISRAGAIGEMQLMPATARDLQVDPADPEQNLRGGARYLKAMLNRYRGDLSLALAAYNAGPAAVDRYGGIPPYTETRRYVTAIMDRLSRRALVGGGISEK